MVKSTPSTIILKAFDYAMNEGIVSNAAITPGSLVMLHSDGTVRDNATADRRTGALVAVEYELGQYSTAIAGGIDTDYAVGDRIKYAALRSGDEFYALIAAAEPAIALGARLTAGPTGTVANSAAANDDFLIALEAVDNSAGGTPARIKVRVA
jgi:hypothetical protein